ncbi:hypothetical protein B0H19DRAFT_1204302 [Mycena capillaripes]|nr:hypothetical protein B0H19DRAFT_1204302 [Mycena capillaripes]
MIHIRPHSRHCPTSTMAAASSSLGAVAAEVTALNDYAAVRYTNIAFLAWMVFDHAITFEAEVARIWTSTPVATPKVLFLINRYVVPPMLMFPVIFDLPESLCTFIAKWTAWPTILSLATVEIILMLRVFAICEMIAWVTVSSIIMHETTGVPGGSLFPGCLIPPVVFESTIVIITLYYLTAYEWSRKINVTLRVLARDSMIYFLIMFCTSGINRQLLIARFGRDFLGSLFIA